MARCGRRSLVCVVAIGICVVLKPMLLRSHRQAKAVTRISAKAQAGSRDCPCKRQPKSKLKRRGAYVPFSASGRL